MFTLHAEAYVCMYQLRVHNTRTYAPHINHLITHPRTHTHTHARTHARTYAHTYTIHKYTHIYKHARTYTTLNYIHMLNTQVYTRAHTVPLITYLQHWRCWRCHFGTHFSLSLSTQPTTGTLQTRQYNVRFGGFI